MIFFNNKVYRHKFFYRKHPDNDAILYFVPHQDDELLSMGIDICINAINRKNVHIILCTDGSTSGVRKRLANNQECLLHKEKHIFELNEKTFSEARDAEFIESCLSLGVLKENIHIPSERAIDGLLTESLAKKIVCYYLDILGKGSTCCTIYFDNGESQHKDHRALGAAVWNLFQEGVVRKAKFFKEPYCQNEQIKFVSKSANSECIRRVKRAIGSYMRWYPNKGRYAIEYHSVQRYFKNLRREKKVYYYMVHK